VSETPEPRLAEVVLENIARRIGEERGIEPDVAHAWMLERVEASKARAMARVAIRTWQTFAPGEDRDAELEELYELIEAEVSREIDSGWRAPGT
jgi:hypothetical protein